MVTDSSRSGRVASRRTFEEHDDELVVSLTLPRLHATMSSEDEVTRSAFNTLKRRVLVDKGIVTYRLLSRLVPSPIHVHLAKQILFAFHRQNRSNGVHATYLITGLLRDGEPDGKMDVDGKEEEEEEKTSIRTAVVLVAEEDLDCEHDAECSLCFDH
jgi:hypothetical protein